MKITDYEKVTQLLANNVLLVDGDGGTKTILARAGPRKGGKKF